MSNLFELKLEDSPFPQAMDLYYEQLAALVRTPSRASKVALVSNISTCPIRKGTRLFNKYVTRSFADRSIERGSPESTLDNFLGPADFTDQFSSQYGVLLDRVSIGIDLRLSPEKRADLELSRRRVKEVDVEIDKVYDEVIASWVLFRDKTFPGKTDDELIMERIAWFSSHRLARKLDTLLTEVDRELTLQQQLVETVGDADSSLIYKLKNNLLNSVVYYCKSWELEEALKLNELHMADPLKVDRAGSKGWADRGTEIDTITDFDQFLSLQGSRALSIELNQQTTSLHERSWSASASYSYGWFFTATANASEHSRLAQSLKNSVKVRFGFERIDQLWIRRGDWYSSALFQTAPVVAALGKDPKLAARLKYVVSSIIVGRGLNLSIEFERESESSYFHSFAASGSASILGIIPLGGGNASGQDQRTEYDKKNKAVHFIDDAQLTRLLGFTVEPLHDVVADEDVRKTGGKFISAAELEEFFVKEHGAEADNARGLVAAMTAAVADAAKK